MCTVLHHSALEPLGPAERRGVCVNRRCGGARCRVDLHTYHQWKGGCRAPCDVWMLSDAVVGRLVCAGSQFLLVMRAASVTGGGGWGCRSDSVMRDIWLPCFARFTGMAALK